jgi:hypothetical protein
MKKMILLVLFFITSAAVSGQSENPSVFVMNLAEDALESKNIVKKDEISIDKTNYMTEQNGLVILAYETIYPLEYINTLDKDGLSDLLKSVNQEGFEKLNGLMGTLPENPAEKNIKFKNAAETIQTSAKVNGMNFESTTLRSQNNFLQIIFIGEVKSKEAQDFMSQLEIIVVE